ncbi:hypothetical protein GCM10023307_33770 [Lysobacter hankyongensis]|uniref:Uncharacterized protein n=1 Tax=Lysobacter hankyongensis TaxID=1176535 RepID=A0ABP9C449_9GAMM
MKNSLIVILPLDGGETPRAPRRPTLNLNPRRDKACPDRTGAYVRRERAIRRADADNTFAVGVILFQYPVSRPSPGLSSGRRKRR